MQHPTTFKYTLCGKHNTQNTKTGDETKDDKKELNAAISDILSVMMKEMVFFAKSGRSQYSVDIDLLLRKTLTQPKVPTKTIEIKIKNMFESRGFEIKPAADNTRFVISWKEE